MDYTHIIWDFNGTILDDLQICIDAVNKMLKIRDLPPIESVDKYRELFGFPIKEYYRRCGFDFELYDYETVLAPEWVKEYNDHEHETTLCEGIEETLLRFKSAGLKQSVVSASKFDMLKKQIDRLGIGSFFLDTVGCDNFFAYGKEKILSEYVNGFEKDSFLLIGDTSHDAEAAKEAGIDCVLLLTGHMSRDKLEKCGCRIYDNAVMLAQELLDK